MYNSKITYWSNEVKYWNARIVFWSEQVLRTDIDSELLEEASNGLDTAITGLHDANSILRGYLVRSAK